MIALRIALLTGRYTATAYNDRMRAEWPPHPARVYSALVAAHHSRPEPPPEERAALEWLEAQPPPDLVCSEESGIARRSVVTHFVPVNDTTVHSLPSRDKYEAAVAALEAATQEVGQATDSRARRAAERARDKQEEAVKNIGKKLATATLAASQLGSRGGTPQQAMELLPEHRVRQPRTFPSVTPAADVVWLCWSEDPPPPLREALRELAADVVSIGHSSSLVSVSVASEAPEPSLVPSAYGEPLRITGEGQLAALEQAHARHQGVSPRILPARFQPYAPPRPPQTELPTSHFGSDFLILERADGLRLTTARSVDLATGIRGALMRYAKDPIPAALSGHEPDGAPLQRSHLAIVPLPFVGHPQATGAILGVALIFPTDLPPDERRAINRALYRWERDNREEEERHPRLRLLVQGGQELWLQRVGGLSQYKTLQPSSWIGPGQVWGTATPIALDRNPGDLNSRDPHKAAEAAAAAEAIIAQAAINIGLPRPEVQVTPATVLAGSRKARQHPSFPPQNNKLQRILLHARLTFPEPVQGPVLLGAGRYRGLGLCRPLRQE